MAHNAQTQIKKEHAIKNVLKHIKIGNFFKKDSKQINDAQHMLESCYTNKKITTKIKSHYVSKKSQ